MEVEISSYSLNCSRYWSAAVVTDDSHVVLLVVEAHVPNSPRASYPYTPYATRSQRITNANLLNNSNK
ncbi:hypothetical protein BH20ACI3_BH20ACI3_25180 [soil metagenome]